MRLALPHSFDTAGEAGTLFTDKHFAALFPSHGQPAFAPRRLALVSILPFAEGLSGRQAAHADRSRTDWKYLLRLGRADSGFNASVLSEFRSHLLAGAAEQVLFNMLLWFGVESGPPPVDPQ